MKRYLLLLPILLICTYAQAQTWQQVPIRTKAQQTAGLSGGEGMQLHYGLTYAPSNPNIVYLVSDTSQVWKSTDGGTTWQRKHKGFRAMGGACVVVSPYNENLVLVAGSIMVSGATSGGDKIYGIFRSTDGGENWTQVNSLWFRRANDDRGGKQIAFASSQIVYAGTSEEGIYRSTDGGATWSQIVTTAQLGATMIMDIDVGDISVSQSYPITLFAVLNSNTYKIRKIVDNGASQTISTVSSGLTDYPNSLTIDPQNSSTAYACVSMGASSGYGVYKTTNLNSGTPTFTQINNGMGSNKRATYLEVSPVDSNYVYVSVKSGFYYSRNGGNTWAAPISQDEQNADGWVSGSNVEGNAAGSSWFGLPITVHPTNKNVVLQGGQSSHVKKTTDGGINLRYSSTGYTGGLCGWAMNITTATSPIGWDKNNPSRYVFFLADTGPFFTEDGGSTFRTLLIPKYNGFWSTLAGAIDNNVIIAASGSWQTQRIAITRNANVNPPSWTSLVGTEDFYQFIAFHPTNSNIAYAGQYKFTSIQSNNNYSTLSRRVIAMYPGNGDIVYSYGQVSGTTVIYKSTDGGSTWTTPYPSIPTTTKVSQVTIHPTNPDKIYVATNGRGIYIIDGTSLSLKNDAHGLDKSWFNSIDTSYVTIDPNNTNVLYAGYYKGWIGHTSGIYRSVDGGDTWTNITGNLGPEFTVESLVVNPFDSYIYIGSPHGTWKLAPPGGDDPPAPVGGLPSVTTGTATSVGSSTATLQGVVNPNSGTTTYRWQLGTVTQTYTLATGSSTINASQGTTTIDVATVTTGLLSSTNYFTRIQANNGSGSVSGSETAFTTTGSRTSYNAIQTGTTTITVDGILVDWINLPNNMGNTVSGTPSATYAWGAMWRNGTAGGLYVAVQATDSSQYNDAGTATIFLGDGCEVYIDRDNNKGTTYDSYDRQIVTGYGSGSSILISAGGTTTGIVVAGSNTAGSTWTKEIFVPWSLFPGGSVPAADTIIGFDVQGNDRNIGSSTRLGAKEWNNTQNTSYYDTSNFGELLLTGTSAISPVTEGCIVSSTNLVGHYAFNDGAGTNVTDYSTNNNTGTITGSVWGTGTIGNALFFDGIDDVVSCTNESLYDFERTNSFSVAGWVKAYTMTGTTTDGVIITKITTASPYRGWNLVIDTANNSNRGKPYLRLTNTYNTNIVEKHASSRIDTGQWKHVACTYDGTSLAAGINIYIDGTISSNGSVTYNSLSATILNDQTLRIGNFSGGGATFWGFLDDLRIYNRALSGDEINCLYTDTTPPTVQSTTPGSATTGVSVDSNINATFTETLDTNFIGTSTFYVGTVTGSVSSGTGTISFNPDSNLGANTTYPANASIRIRDAAGNPMLNNYIWNFTTASGTDTTAPAGTITLHNGATYATSTAISIQLTATDAFGVEGYFLDTGSTTPYATQSGWVDIGTTTSYSNSIPYTLSTTDGTKTIFSWFKDGVNNISNMSQDSIILDTIYTSISVGTPSASCNLHSDNSKVFGTTGTSINLGGLAYDENLVTMVKVSNNATSTVLTATGTDSWTRAITLIGTSGNLISTTGFDTPTNQGTDTIYIGNYSIPTTGTATDIGTVTVTLNGSVTANLGNTATCFFEYGSITVDENGVKLPHYYTGSTSTYIVNAPGTITEKTVSIGLSGLDPLTEYFYRLAVTNDLGTTVSYETTFTTDELPNEWSVVTGGSWVYHSQFSKTDFIVYLRSINRYRSFRKHIRSSKDWAELMSNPDSKLSSLPVD